MRKVLEQLLALQSLHFNRRTRTPEIEALMEQLREGLPAPVLAHFSRMALRWKKCAAIAHNGVCGECHVCIPSGTLAGLAYDNDLYLCDNCGCYLYLPEDEPLGLNDFPNETRAPNNSNQRNIQPSQRHCS